MGEVYRAHDSRLGRDVALKLLPETLASSPDRLVRFEREARTVAALNHPNIVTLLTIEEARGVRFLVMELVEGRDLSTMVVSGGLPLAKILDTAIPLADALVAAHERRVVHRDLKPANVMLTRDGRVKVLDFGLAKLMAIGSEFDLTQTIQGPSLASQAGAVVGTVPYMAPEQIRGEEADVRSDLFSFGILVYELATGRRPFVGQSSADVSSAILSENPPALMALRADLPTDLGRIVERCLEKNPRERFQTALDVANELRALRRTVERGAPAPAPASSEKVASIAVLPFVNRSASADDEYFSDGLADELLNVLTKIRGLRVAARTSAFQFKGRNEDIAAIGQKLRVATLLEGSVSKSGNRVRISVRLVHVSDGYHLWSETYDRTLDDIFAVQDDIAQSVVKELRAALLGQEEDSKASGEVRAEVSNAARGRGTNPQAHRLYLQARYLIEQQNDVVKAIEYLQQAVKLDPEFALGWAELGGAYCREGDIGLAPSDEAYPKGRRAVDRALGLEPDLPEGHTTLAKIQANYDWDWDAAGASLRRALDLSPMDVPALRLSGTIAGARGRAQEAIAHIRRALEHDPLNPASFHVLGRVLDGANLLVEGEQACRRALELAPGRVATHALLAFNLLAQGRGEDARNEAAQEPEESLRLPTEACIEEALQNQLKADQALRRLIAEYGSICACQIAEIYAARRDDDAAFAWLERAYAQHDGGLYWILSSRVLRSLHQDPRWVPFMLKMRLADA